MPFGAHESMELHEILTEKINMITHFNLYAQEARNPQLLDMIVRHQQEEIVAYNEMVSMAHGNTRFTPIPANTDIKASEQQVRYGLTTRRQAAPQADAVLSDSEIATAMLLCHKNAARNASWAALECADPNLRRTMMNSAATCMNQAYEVFLFMNQQGLYQVPTLNPQTAETFLNSYQPAPQELQAEYGVQGAGRMGQTANAYGAGNVNTSMNMAGQSGMERNAAMNPGARDSVLYGDRGGAPAQSPAASFSAYGNMRSPGQMQQSGQMQQQSSQMQQQ
ncbi:spore coat protein [Alicyclobacillus dauci]|uniref:Spore coat protein n=1 Tax=Alicyclobacillus dauci TaxID=1475485 RepID=A0ABY6Z223_9BACL|nr:spore coat protein [Alicyclobacillus dauci]WAH36953.1 spore coat protein [Alicyclobacillus dauci]